MPHPPKFPVPLTIADARRIWLRAQRLDAAAPFGAGAGATQAAIEHLGYVQIDTINVIERCHHHILFTRIPDYQRAHLHAALSRDKSVFEYWTHALSYVPTRDMRFFLADMQRHRQSRGNWHSGVSDADIRKIVARVRREGALSIRDIDDDVLVEKDHAWASKKPSKRALQLAFFSGALTISARAGMLKTYELAKRHFGWDKRPKPATETEVLNYLVDRALRAQGLVSLDSICHLDAARKPAVRRLIEGRVRKGFLLPAAVAGAEKTEHWATPQGLEVQAAAASETTHILSPFDPLIIQRKRLKLLFGYEHRFEAYVPKDKRIMGYFALPVLVGDEIVAAIDLKADREKQVLKVQQWTWIGKNTAKRHKAGIEEELHRFEAFQLSGGPRRP